MRAQFYSLLAVLLILSPPPQCLCLSAQPNASTRLRNPSVDVPAEWLTKVKDGEAVRVEPVRVE